MPTKNTLCPNCGFKKKRDQSREFSCRNPKCKGPFKLPRKGVN